MLCQKTEALNRKKLEMHAGVWCFWRHHNCSVWKIYWACQQAENVQDKGHAKCLAESTASLHRRSRWKVIAQHHCRLKSCSPGMSQLEHFCWDQSVKNTFLTTDWSSTEMNSTTSDVSVIFSFSFFPLPHMKIKKCVVFYLIWNLKSTNSSLSGY